ncbi:P-loop containing nucleoside triphosphate hydrolase protein [Talaromyces proteolyticus]|uniref:P-loop containing nucleoside triphosphate hydrolase protein n=1 Tax=Talaromyces proteolyticus TaxID=1131652 RepID=A0AAD4KYE1_9EURO|nr:P-loop containing nucleoside triphosphate hydrolase protein [Talaromyces proteolyticus]KAH8702556.1 P-loop containing nucleoside triphosphate hydrolase protein [Talaromyces proteolyticus]
MDHGQDSQDDPFDWSVDQVVQYLCDNNLRPWTVSRNPSSLPDSTLFEAALREHGITGEVLLNGHLENFFRNTLKLKEGPFYSVDRAIQHARRNSAKYLAHISQERQYYAAAITPMIANNIPPPLIFNAGSISNFVTPHRDVSHSGSLVNSFHLASTGDRQANEQLLAGLQTIQASPSPRPTNLIETRSSAEPSATMNNADRQEITPKSSPRIRHYEHIHIDEDGRKRRRLDIAPKEQQPSIESPVEIQQQDPHTWYIGPKKFDPADIFYPIQADSKDDNLNVLASKFSTGQRLFVKRKLLRFYRQPAVKLSAQGSSRRTAVFPCDSNGLYSEKPRFFTLYTSCGGKVTVTMESTAKYDDLVQDTIDISPPDRKVDNFDYLLQKYPAKDDEITFPVFGDSGSEGEYDSETWDEMNIEQEELAIQAQSEPKFLSSEKVDMVIEQCIKSYLEKWKAKHKPKLALEVHNLWLDAFQNKCRNSCIKAILDDINRLKSRLQKIKDELHGHDWADPSHLTHQCQSMEQTIYGIEAQKWRMSVLESSQCPPKPPAKSSAAKLKKKVARAQPDEESLDSSSDDESLNDFIVIDMEIDAQSEGGHDVSPNVPKPSPQPTIDFQSITDSRRASVSSKAMGISTHENASSPADNSNHASDLANNQTRCGFYYSSDDETDRSTPPPPAVNFEDVEIIDLTGSPLSAVPSPLEGMSRDNAPPGSILRSSPSRRLELGSKDNRDENRKHFQPISKELGVSKLESRPSIPNLHDRKKLLRLLIRLLPELTRSKMLEAFTSYSSVRFKRLIKEGLDEIGKSTSKIRSLNDLESDLVMRATTLYIGWIACQRLWGSGIPKKLVRDASINIDENNPTAEISFETFKSQLLEILRHYDIHSHGSTLLNPSSGASSYTDDSGRSDNDDESHPFPSRSRVTPKKRKRLVKEDQAVKSGQAAAKQRVEVQEQQRKILEQRLELTGVSNDDPEHHPISFEQPTIFLHPHIGRRVKPHQLSGIQFMWRELVQNEKHDGCLLAHTMGLGKTMQVISLLVTIAAAAHSPDPSIRNQVPESFRRSQTLILCPPSLIENWYEEFLMWTPKEHGLGPIQKVSSADYPEDRVSIVDSWNSNGGILILSYHLFRTWVGQNTVSEHVRIRDQLLKGPRIVVADEAHQMKNSSSLLAQSAALIESKSRIALTGSPLANNLMDYYAMVNWISPKYLDDVRVFRAKYVEPIEQGLFFDSSYYEQRRSLKKLQVLKEILTPKVSRADISVLERSLPKKIEFVITIPLTQVQKEAYNRYATDLLSGNSGIKATSINILSWLAILGLCCNHPICFYDKLQKRAEEPQSKNLSDVDQELSPVDVSLSSLGFNDAMWNHHKKLLSVYTDLEDPKYSHRAEIFIKIVEESVRVGDKILCFSQSIPTLDYLDKLLRLSKTKFSRLDGSTAGNSRQAAIKAFNRDPNIKIYLISTRAGGLGLNITGANRVIIFDFGFNPTWEEQAVGRAYRLGQHKPVYIYRFLAGGTFEEIIHNKSIFKTQLAMRVVDKKNVERSASKSLGDYLFLVKDVGNEDVSEYIGKDPDVLDKILLSDQSSRILNIALTETFCREDNEKLTEDEQKEIQEELELELLRQSDPVAYERKIRYYLPVNAANNVPHHSALLPPQHHPQSGFYIPADGLTAAFDTAGQAISHTPTFNTRPSNAGPPPIPPNMISGFRFQTSTTESPAEAFTLISNSTPTEDHSSGLPEPVSLESLTGRVSDD